MFINVEFKKHWDNSIHHNYEPWHKILKEYRIKYGKVNSEAEFKIEMVRNLQIFAKNNTQILLRLSPTLNVSEYYKFEAYIDETLMYMSNSNNIFIAFMELMLKVYTHHFENGKVN